MRELVAEQRREADVALAVVLTPLVSGGPGGPDVGLHRMRGRTQRQDVQHHRLHIPTPVMVQESFAGLPSHGDEWGARLGPRPVHAAVKRIGQSTNLGFSCVGPIEVLLAGEHPHEEQRGVDGRQLDVLEPEPTAVLQEVIEEALVPGGARGLGTLWQLPEKPQRGEGAVPRFGPGDVAPLCAYHVGREAESDGCDAGECAGGPPVGREAGGRIGSFPEKVEAAAGKGVEKGGLAQRQRPLKLIRCGRR